MLSFNDDGLDDVNSGPQHSTPIKLLNHVIYDNPSDCIPPADRQGQPDQQLAVVCQVDGSTGLCTVPHHQHAYTQDSSHDNNTLTLEEISVIEGSFMRRVLNDSTTPPQCFNDDSADRTPLKVKPQIYNTYRENTQTQSHYFPYNIYSNSQNTDAGFAVFSKQSVPPSSSTDMTWAKYLSCPSNMNRSNKNPDNILVSPLQCQNQDYVVLDNAGPDFRIFTTTEDLTTSSQRPVNSESRNVNVSGFMIADLKSYNSKKSNDIHSLEDVKHFSRKGQSAAAHIELDVINKQRREIHLLMEELGTRDRELNDLVRSHQSQVQAWEKDRERLSDLQHRLHQYQDELEQNDQQLKETVAEMSRVCEQKEADNADLRKTKEEMEQLAEKINENSLYIQGIEVENKNLTQQVRELIKIKQEMQERDKEREITIKEKDDQILKSKKRMEAFSGEIKDLQMNLEQTNEKLNEVSSDGARWKKKFFQAKEDADRLQDDGESKDETISRLSQQLQESVQQSIALQKALFTSCEREKCKEEVVLSMRKQQKRTMEELTSLRHLYDRQNRDLTLYHLSVREHEKAEEMTRQQRRSRERCKSLDKVEIDGRTKDSPTKSERVRSKSELKHHPTRDSDFLVDELKTSSEIISLTNNLQNEENEKNTYSNTQCGSSGQNEQMKQKNERNSRCSTKSINVNSDNSIKTISTKDSKRNVRDISENPKTNSVQSLLQGEEDGNLENDAKSESSSTLLDDPTQSCNHNSIKNYSLKGNSRHKNRILNMRNIFKDSDIGEKCEYSDSSQLSSPERTERSTRFDEEIVSADSEGMCPELKRGVSGQNFRPLPSRGKKKSLIRDLPSSLEPSICPSSFLKKELLPSAHCGDGDDTTQSFYLTNESRNVNIETNQLTINSNTQISLAGMTEGKTIIQNRDIEPSKQSIDKHNKSRNKKDLEKQKFADKKYQAGDYVIYGYKNNLNEPKTNPKVKFSMKSINDHVMGVESDGKAVNMVTDSGHKHIDQYSVDEFSEEEDQSKHLIKYENDRIRVNRSNSEHCENMKSKYRVEEIEGSKCYNSPRSRHTSTKSFPNENEGKDRDISPTKSDGFLNNIKITKANVKTRSDSKNFCKRNETFKTKAEYPQQEGETRYLNGEDKCSTNLKDNRSKKCIKFEQNPSKSIEQDDSQISNESYEFNRSQRYEERERIQQRRKSYNLHESFKNKFENKSKDPNEDISLSGIKEESELYYYKEDGYLRNAHHQNTHTSAGNQEKNRETDFNNSNTDLKQTNSCSLEENIITEVNEIETDTSEKKEIFSNFSNINQIQLKPFSSTKAPSLFKQLSKIHFCEKTKRYEWTSVSNQQLELKGVAINEDEYFNKSLCSGNCSLTIDSTQHKKSIDFRDGQQYNLVEDSQSSSYVENFPIQDKLDFTCEVNSENNIQINESNFLEKPSFLSPENKTSSIICNVRSKSEQFETVVKKLNFSATFDEDDLNENEKFCCQSENLSVFSNFDNVSTQATEDVNMKNNSIEEKNEIEHPKFVFESKASITDEGLDNFTVNSQRNIQLCQKEIETNLDLDKTTNEPINITNINDNLIKNEDNETGYMEDYTPIKAKAKSDSSEAQTVKMLHLTSSGYMSFEGIEGPNYSKNSESHRLSDKVGIMPATTIYPEIQRSVKKYPVESCNNSVQKIIPMSPATRLHRLLIESQDMLHCIEKSSAIHQSLKAESSLPSPT